MADFNPINSQEEFDAIIKSRLERERETVRKEFVDYEQIKSDLATKTKEAEELTGKITGFETQIKELQTKLTATETSSAKMRIAGEVGLPFSFCDRLKGTNEEEIRKDAEELKQFFDKQAQPAQPLFNPEPEPVNAEDAAYKRMLQDLTK